MRRTSGNGKYQFCIGGEVAMSATRASERMLRDRSTFPHGKWLGSLTRNGLFHVSCGTNVKSRARRRIDDPGGNDQNDK